jgi:hypothetical protein
MKREDLRRLFAQARSALGEDRAWLKARRGA